MRRFMAILLTVLFLAGVMSSAVAEEEPARHDPPGVLRLHMIDIGCGDAYLLTVDDLVLLIDCGTNSTVPIAQHSNNPPLFGYLAASGIDHVDMHIVTHWHNDHCYNVDTLAEMYGTGDLVVYGVTEELYSELRPLPVGTYRQLKDGDRLKAGPLDILCVGPEYRDFPDSPFNIFSLNFIITYGNIRFLFTGDWVDKTVLTRWKDEIADIDVLDFPHHGLEPICMEQESMKQINPRVITITSHERGTVRRFCKQSGLAEDPVFLSVLDGNTQIITDGTALWYASHVKPGEFPDGEAVPPRKQ